MEFVHGCKVTDVEAIKALGLKPEDVANEVSSLFAEMIFCSGFVHCDPHPGNLLVRQHPSNPSHPQILLLDHGLYRQLDDSFRKTFCQLWKALLVRDKALLEKVGEALQIGPYTKLLPLIFTYRTMDSRNRLAGQLTAADRKALVKDFQFLDGSHVHAPPFIFHIRRRNDCLFTNKSGSV
jgi:aarF domain-containing kinase